MSSNSQNINNIWLSADEACSLLGIKKDTFRKHCSKGKYTARVEKINGNKEYKILLISLPVEIQAKYFGEDKKFSDDIETNMMIYNKAPKWAREKVNKYIMILNKSKGLFGKELIDFVYQLILSIKHPTVECLMQEERMKNLVYQVSLQNTEIMQVKQRLRMIGISILKACI